MTGKGRKMKLQLLVPHWKEEPWEMFPLLDSVALQQSVDFKEVGMVIVYDGDEATELPELDWQRKYPYDIQFVNAPHGGVSAARNAALDAATADYVMFCDSDDMFCHACGLWIVFNEIEKGFDTMASNFTEETRHPDTKKPVYISHDRDSTFVHGKVHRRQYLVDNRIRFNPALTIHEDSYFNILAQNLTEKPMYMPTPFYLWRWRDNSVCRHDPNYLLKTYVNMLDSNDALVDEFHVRGREDKAMFYAGFMVFDAYYTMNKNEWMDVNNKEYRDMTERRFAVYFRKHKEQWERLPHTEKMNISNGIRTRSITEGMGLESMTIGEWLKHIEEVA